MFPCNNFSSLGLGFASRGSSRWQRVRRLAWQWRFWLVPLLLFGAVSGFGQPAPLSSRTSPPPAGLSAPARILLLSPYNTSFAQHQQMMTGFIEQMRSSGESYWLNPLEYDALNGISSRDIEASIRLLQPDLEQGYYDIIVTFGKPALDLLGSLGAAIPESTAIVFSGQEEFDRSRFPRQWSITGVLQDVDPGPSIDLIRRLLPAKRQLVLLANWTSAGNLAKERAAVHLRRDPGLELVCIDNATVSWEAMLARIDSLGQESVVLLQGWYNQQGVNTASLQKLLRELGRNPDVPVFVMHDAMLDQGVVGGSVESGRLTGQQAAAMAIAILRGQPAADIPVQRVGQTVMLNWMMLKRYGIDVRLIPESATVIGAPVTLWSEYRGWVLGGALYGIVLLALAAALIVYMVRYRRFGERMRAVFQHLPVHVGVADALGRIHLYYPGRDPSLASIARPEAVSNLPVELAAVIRAELPKVMSSDQGVSQEYVVDGKHRHLEMVGLPESVFGRRTALWVSADVEELSSNRLLLQSYVDQLASQKAVLEKREEENRLILDNLDIPAGLYGPDGKLLRINAPLCEIVGRSADAILADPETDLFRKVLPVGARSLLERALEARGPVREEVRLGDRDFQVRAMPVLNAAGDVINIVKTAVDVTDVNQLAANERVLNRCLEALLLTEDFDAAIVTVLRAIQGHLAADNCFVINYDFGRRTMFCRYEVHAAGGMPLAATLAPMPLPESAAWLDALSDRQMLRYEEVAAGVPAPEAADALAFIAKDVVASRYRQGVYTEGRLWGDLNVVFRNRPRGLSERGLSMLRALAHLMEIVLERRDSRLRLEAAEREKRLLLDAVPIPILLYSVDGALRRCNNAAIALAGRSEEEILREPLACNRFFCHASERTAECPVLRTAADAAPHTSEVVLGQREFLFQSYPVMAGDVMAYILKTMIDVTDVNRSRREAEAALAQARQAENAKSRFLAIMSHELRTPLNAIIGFSELLAGLKVNHEQEKEYVSSIHGAGKALLDLINDILDLSKIEAGQMPIVPQPTRMPVLLAELDAVFRPAAARQGLKLDFEVAAALPVLCLDKRRVRQILFNLIGNALKFTREGGITVKAEYSGSALVLQVCDTGIGIAPQWQKSIFEPYVQQDAIRDAGELQGTGLGLSISRQLAEKMGGSLTLVSEPGKGSVFTCRLQDVPVGEAEVCPAEVETAAAPVRYGARILVVDDVALNLKMMSAMLSGLGYLALTASASDDALAQMAREKVDVVLTDMWMPGMNGRELARRVKVLYPDAKVVVVTADAEIAAGGASDFDGVLLKPTTLGSLQAVLNRVLGR